MHNEVSSLTGAAPLTSIVLSFVGVAGYCSTAAAKFASGSGHMLAQAMPDTSDHVQMIYAAMAAVGAVIGGWNLIQGKINDARRAEEKKDADAARERDFKDAVSRLEIQAREAKLALELHREEFKDHLCRQDSALAEIKQAIQPTNTTASVVAPPAGPS